VTVDTAAPAIGVGALVARSTGNALVIHPHGENAGRALKFAAGLAPDPLHHLVVLDLPGRPGHAVLVAVATLIGRFGPRNPAVGIRLVPGRGTPVEITSIARELANRIDRTVLAPDGRPVPTPGGGLFVPAGVGAGWIRYGPGGLVERASRRYPQPRWESALPDGRWRLGEGAVVQPIAGACGCGRSTPRIPTRTRAGSTGTCSPTPTGRSSCSARPRPGR
jgi:hypothetical protein